MKEVKTAFSAMKGKFQPKTRTLQKNQKTSQKSLLLIMDMLEKREDIQNTLLKQTLRKRGNVEE